MKKSGTYVAENDKATAEYRKTRREKPFFRPKIQGGDKKYRIFISTMSDIIIMIRIVLIS